MSRPRPPLHDPYGLLRPPPPEDPISLYSTSNALTSTTSLPLSTNSPNRRARQRGASPSRTQRGEEYEDQPYLTNVVRHHGQVTLVPPVNQGRTRKARRKRGPEAAASTISLADTLAGPSSSSDPSRVSAGPQPRSRRPRQGSETRAVSSPDVRDSSYPDYPPPSFEEVLALDRNNASSTPPTDEPARAHDVSSPMFLVSAPPSLSDPSHNPTATPWEHDRLLGLSLEERVRREYERKLKQPSGSESATTADCVTSLLRPSSPLPVSPTATSVTASFLTPQNLTPPSGAALLLSTPSSPKATESRQSSSPPLVPPKLANTPTARTNETLPDHDAGLVVRNAPVEPQLPVSTELGELGIGGSDQTIGPEPTRLDQLSPQGTSHDSGVPLTSLLFTTRLRLDSSPEHSPVREPGREISPVRGSLPEAEAKVSQAATRETAENSPRRNAFPRVHPEQIVPFWETTSGPSRATSPIRNSSPSRPVDTVRSPSPKAPPTLLNTPVPAVPARAIAESSLFSSTAPSRRPPPPPPPRPRQRPAGSGVAARISAYESLLANAPKVPPPIPPRPRPRSQTTLDNPPEAQAARDVPGASTGAAVSNSVQQTAAGHMIEEPNEPRGTHIVPSHMATRPPRPPPRPASVHATTWSAESPSRPASVVLHDVAISTSQTQSNYSGSRPLGAPGPSLPQRPVSTNVQSQTLVHPRVGSGSTRTEPSSVLGDAHTATLRSTDIRPRSMSRPASIVRQTTTSPPPTSPQRQSNELVSRPLPVPVPLRPERPASANVEAQALVPARVGPDGKLEIIPDAEVIWLDKPHAETPEPQSGPSGSRSLSERLPPPSSVVSEATVAFNREPEVNPFEDSFLNPPAAAPPMSRQSSTASSVYQPPSPVQGHPPLPGPSTSALTAVDSPTLSPPPHLADDFEYTDLDLLISRLEESEASRQGANYEQLLTVGEVLGPAHPPAPRPDLDLNVGLIEIQRRRVMKDGRVKLKLSLMGVGVDKCGICLTQFKNNESAVLLPCLHSFHTNCIMSWFVRQDVPACPHCRTPVPQ